LGGVIGFDAGAEAEVFVAAAVDVAAVLEVGLVRFTLRGEVCEKHRLLVTWRWIVLILQGEDVRTAPIKGRIYDGDAIVYVSSHLSKVF